VNPKAYPAWRPDLCGHAMLADDVNRQLRNHNNS